MNTTIESTAPKSSNKAKTSPRRNLPQISAEGFKPIETREKIAKRITEIKRSDARRLRMERSAA